MNDEKKQRLLFLRLAYSGTAVTLVSLAAIIFLPSLQSVFITLAALSAAGAAVLFGILFDQMRKRIDCSDRLVEKANGYAEIRYDKKTETAVISGKFSEITGLDVPNGAIDDTDYKKLVLDMISYPSSAGVDIYMAARPESWIKIHNFENEDFEITMISDVSELVSCQNIIKSLKYYDSETGVLCRDAFISKVRSVSGSHLGTVGLINLLISGVDKLSSFKGTSAADRVVARAASFIKKFENPHNIFSGRTATNEFCVLITDTYEEGCRKYADKLFNGLNDILASSDGSEYIRVYCGYALFSGEENDAGTMMSAVDYAAFEAKSSASEAPVEFDRANFVLRAYDFKKIQVFKKIIEENLVNYYFQPVVDARTGTIFGYEALMRPQETDGIKLSPIEVVDIASEQGMSAAVEYLTISRTVSYLWENRRLFNDKKLFVNAIPNCLISDELYAGIADSYGGVFDKLVIEITEGLQITPESVEVIRERYGTRGALIAMDDYGTGYANESTLLSISPDFIKIDRSLIMEINNDVQKQHLVSNMIDFAKNHGIKALAEGVETRDELEILITFGIDLIQGFYTSKPSPALIPEIPASVRDEILEMNLKNIGYNQKTYTVDSDEPRDLAKLAVYGYTDILIESENAFFTGSASCSVSLRMKCPDGYRGNISICGVNVFGLDAPVLTLGKNCDVTLTVDGKNFFSYEGIRVPASSSLTINGEGQLNIDMNSPSGVIIGGGCLQDFGLITVNIEGSLNITSQSGSVAAIGGGFGGETSAIDIKGGLITAELKGESLIGIGAVSGNVGINLRNCNIDIDAAGQNVIAIGTRNGKVNLDCGSTVAASCSGDNCCCFGSLENGGGSLSFDGAYCDLAVRSKNGAAIGAVNGNFDIKINSGEYNIFCEGNSAVGIGDCFGSGNVAVSGGVFKMHIAASTEVSIGSAKGETVIAGGSIVSDSREKINAVSPYGAPLEEIRMECGNFSEKISIEGNEYVYNASAFRDETFVSVYLPVGYELKYNNKK